MLLAMFAGWISRHPQDIIEYLKTENTILRSGIYKKRGKTERLSTAGIAGSGVCRAIKRREIIADQRAVGT